MPRCTRREGSSSKGVGSKRKLIDQCSSRLEPWRMHAGAQVWTRGTKCGCKVGACRATSVDARPPICCLLPGPSLAPPAFLPFLALQERACPPHLQCTVTGPGQSDALAYACVPDTPSRHLWPLPDLSPPPLSAPHLQCAVADLGVAVHACVPSRDPLRSLMAFS